MLLKTREGNTTRPDTFRGVSRRKLRKKTNHNFIVINGRNKLLLLFGYLPEQHTVPFFFFVSEAVDICVVYKSQTNIDSLKSILIQDPFSGFPINIFYFSGPSSILRSLSFFK